MSTKKLFYTLFVCLAYMPFTKLEIQTKEPASFRRESANIITLFMKPYEQIQYDPSREISSKVEESLAQPKNIFKHHRNLMQTQFDYLTDPQGVYVLYGGFVDTIDINRQVRFPRLTQEDEILLVITRQLHPITLHGNTVKFFITEEKDAIDCYKFKRHFDQNKNLYYWDVKKIDLPLEKLKTHTYRTIAAHAIIIFANPHHIFVPLEETIAAPGSNLVLPALYATDELKKDYNALAFMNISRYFDPIHYVTKIAPPQRYAQKIGNI